MGHSFVSLFHVTRDGHAYQKIFGANVWRIFGASCVGLSCDMKETHNRV